MKRMRPNIWSTNRPPGGLTILLLALALALALAACASPAPGPVNVQGTVEAALQATEQAQAGRQATIEAAVAGTRAAETGISLPATAVPTNTPNPFEATVEAAVAATRAAGAGARAAPSPIPSNATQATGRLAAYPGSFVEVIAYSQDGSFMGVSLTGQQSPYTPTHKLFDLRTGQILADLAGPFSFSPAAAAQSVPPHGPGLAAVSEEKGIVIYDLSLFQQVKLIRHPDPEWWNATSTAFSPDGQRLMVSYGGHLGMIDVATGQELRLRPAIEGADYTYLSPDGTILAAVNIFGRAALLDTATGKPAIETPDGQLSSGLVGQGTFRQASFSPDGRWFVLLMNSFDDGGAPPEVFELPTGKPVKALRGHKGAVNKIAFDPAGRWLISAGVDDTLRFWEPGTWREVRSLNAGQEAITALAVSADGRLAATGGANGSIAIWETASGRELRRLTGHQAHVTSLAFRPDGRQLASGDGDGALWAWDLSDLAQ